MYGLSVSQTLNRANSLIKKGNIDKANKLYLTVLENFPENLRAKEGLIKTHEAFAKVHTDQLLSLYAESQYQTLIDKVKNLLNTFSCAATLWNILGAAYAGQGEFDNATDAYKKAILIKPDYPDAFSNLGLALHKQKKLEEAIENFKTAISIKPQFAEAFFNIGNVYQDQGNLKNALKAYSRAVSIKPDFAEAFNNKGNVIKKLGNIDEALRNYKTSIAIKPNYVDAIRNIGVTLKDEGKIEDAMQAFQKALSIKPDNATVLRDIAVTLNRLEFLEPNPDLQKIIISILDFKTLVSPKGISEAAMSLLNFEPKIQNLYQKHTLGELRQSLVSIVSDLCEIPLLLKLMSVHPVANLKLESCLKEIRSTLLMSIYKIQDSKLIMNFQAALALQCFTNEYIYQESAAETIAIQKLEDSLTKKICNGEQPSSLHLLCLASYRGLHEYEWSNHINVKPELEDVVKRQIIEPKHEIDLMPSIEVYKTIQGTVSIDVKKQYEKNPYPRWVNLGLPFASSKIYEVVDKYKLKIFDSEIKDVENPHILIAGCGTGQHPINTASRFSNAKVLAIDLSLPSLAYAKRKSEELGISNIEFMQADILDFEKFEQNFDIIESSGVLHHMADPMMGWRVLTDRLKSGGLMRIGLYSELARQDIVQIREEINQADIELNNHKIKSFRSRIIRSNEDHHQRITLYNDFYSLSNLRDLLFNVQEHRFTLPQIKDCISRLGLKFCGFEFDLPIEKDELNYYSLEDSINLDKWAAYEQINPAIFAGMYQFWCQKTT